MRFVVALTLLILSGGLIPAMAQQTAPAPPIRVIIEVPNDEAGRAFVKDRLTPILPAAQAQVPAGPAVTAPAAAPAGEMSSQMAIRLQELRARALALIEAAPDVPDDIEAATHSFDAMETRFDALWLVAAAALFVAGGFAAQRLVFWATRALFAFIIAAPAETVRQRLTIQAIRVSVAVAFILAFLLGSLGAFLLFPWPPVFREIVLVLLFGRARHTPRRRARARHHRAGRPPSAFPRPPLSTPLAWFWYRWLVWLNGLIVVRLGPSRASCASSASRKPRSGGRGAWPDARRHRLPGAHLATAAFRRCAASAARRRARR